MRVDATKEYNTFWIVFPFLYSLKCSPDKIKIDWEHTEYQFASTISPSISLVTKPARFQKPISLNISVPLVQISQSSLPQFQICWKHMRELLLVR
jgi:hypothetical protein